MFLNVGFDGEKILMDKISRLLIFVRLGIQPSARASRRSCAEVEQNRPSGGFCFH
jgi:hypothetical protein